MHSQTLAGASTLVTITDGDLALRQVLSRNGKTMGTTITVIRDDDAAFFAWTSAGEGFFLNEHKRGVMMLHRATCPHFKGTFHPSASSNPKFLAQDRRDLEQISPGAVHCADCRL